MIEMIVRFQSFIAGDLNGSFKSGCPIQFAHLECPALEEQILDFGDVNRNLQGATLYAFNANPSTPLIYDVTSQPFWKGG